LDGAKFHHAVNSTEGISVPLRPPTAHWVAHGLVGWVLEEKVNMVDARGGRARASWIRRSQGKVDTNKVPAGANSASWKVRDNKQFVSTGGKSGGQGRRFGKQC
jgi:hypothetical protein